MAQLSDAFSFTNATDKPLLYGETRDKIISLVKEIDALYKAQMRRSCGHLCDLCGKGDTDEVYKVRDVIAGYEEREKQKKQEASKRKMDTQGDAKEDTKAEDKRPRTGQTLEEFTRVLKFTEEEERDMLYVQNENWRKYSAQITKLTQYIKKFTDEPGTIFTREEYNVFLDNNPKTKLLIEYFQKYIQSNDVTDDQVMDVFHFASIQNESIIVDAINFVISYEENVDEWEAFLRMTPEDLDTKDIKLAPGIGSKLNTFPADVSPMIYNLTRRLEALQDW
jgi:hypothetical protein